MAEIDSHGVRRRTLFRLRTLVGALALAGMLIACGQPGLPAIPDLPIAIPTGLVIPPLSQLPEYLKDLQLPDLSQVPNLPQLEELAGIKTPPGGAIFAGPIEERIDVGQRLPGTDIELVSVGNGAAQFRIDGLSSTRRVGDSLDYSGAWPGIGGVQYALRMRLYLIGESWVRGAGVQSLIVESIEATDGGPAQGSLHKFPFTAGVKRGERIPGTTYVFEGIGDRGAQLGGMPSGVYPYFKMGDSIAWQGKIRPDIPANYSLRVLVYQDDLLQVGGVVDLVLP